MKGLKHVYGLAEILIAFGNAEKNADKLFKKAAKKSQDHVYKRMRENVSLTCHSIQELRLLGGPYAKSHPIALHVPNWLVHTQEGVLLSAIEKTTVSDPEKSHEAEVGVNESKAPHARYIIFGTSKMVARDFVTGTYNQCKKHVNEIFNEAHKALVEAGDKEA